MTKLALNWQHYIWMVNTIWPYLSTQKAKNIWRNQANHNITMMTLTSLSFLNNAWVEDFYQKFIEDDFSCDLTCTVIVMGEAVSILHMMVKVVSDALEWGIKCLLVTIIENVRFVFTQIYHLHSEVWCMKYKLSTSNDSNALLYRSRSLISLVYLVRSNSGWLRHCEIFQIKPRKSNHKAFSSFLDLLIISTTCISIMFQYWQWGFNIKETK